MRVSIIAAMGQNRVIGRGEALPWDLPADRRHFRELTINHAVIMGRGTFESLGRPLPRRLNIVLTSRDLPVEPRLLRAKTIDEALQLAAGDDETAGREVFIIGGQDVYAQTIGIADRICLTVVHGRFDGDSFFPEFEANGQWQLVSREFRPADVENRWPMDFLTYGRTD